jgi:hypothetical protein
MSCPSLSPIMFLVTWAVFRAQFLTPTKSIAKHTETFNSAEWLHALESKWYLPAIHMQKLIKIHCAKRLPKRSNPCLFGWVFRYTGISGLPNLDKVSCNDFCLVVRGGQTTQLSDSCGRHACTSDKMSGN